MWWYSSNMKIVVFSGVILIALLIWTVVMQFKRDKRTFVGLALLICFGFIPFVIIRSHTAKPVVSAYQVLSDGQIQVQDSTRHCHENIDSTQVFTAIIKQKLQLSLFDVCTICNKTLFDHYCEQLSDAQVYANSVLPLTPGE